MTQLSDFSADEIELLVSLPYRVGVWVSHADDVEGEADDEHEMEALESCIRAVAKKYDGPGLVDDIARETLRRRDSWADWTDRAFNILPEAPRALSLLQSRAGRADAKNYKAALLEIAATVARAYGEFGAFDEWENEGSGLFSALAGKIAGAFSSLSQDDKNHPMNISPAENSAISRLAAALKIDGP
ncbi:MAG: hypothetical protein KDJ75_06480 [Alphaproteobacteria bacterium]|nr:hypothetical protein [Alphaproteobacteria bacterium]